jgi:virginiamycin B lyase
MAYIILNDLLGISKRLLILTITLLTSFAPAIAFFNPAVSAASAYTNYPIPFGYGPGQIATGPDGALWFTEGITNVHSTTEIARMTTSGTFTQFPIPLSADFNEYGASISGMTSGSDGALWFVDTNTNQIERLTTGGQFSAYSVPTQYGYEDYGDVHGITAGPDGALWFTMRRSNKIGRITTSGSITEYQLPNGSTDSSIQPLSITAGSDGALWFTEAVTNMIGRISTSGNVSEYPLPTPNAGPNNITAGPDGALWFNEAVTNKIGRISTSGNVSEYALPADTSNFFSLTPGPDGALWFSVNNYDNGLYDARLGRISTAGDINEYSLFGPQTQYPKVGGVTTGPDGALWLCGGPNGNTNQIIRADSSLIVTPSAPTSVTVATVTQTPTISWDPVSNATSYDIYRNGTLVGTSNSASYTDTSAPDGTNTYYVTAVSSGGVQSSPSSTSTTLTDNTAPSISGSIVGGGGSGGGGGGSGSGGGGSGWSNGDVTVDFICNDNGSGVQSCQSPITISTEGANQSVTGTAVDNAGNTSTATVSGINIDKTPPTITYSVSPTPNSGGWNNSSVTITFSCSDALSGVASCSPPVTVSQDGANQQIVGTAVDNAGNTSSVTATVNVDTSAPTITSALSTAANAADWNNTPVTVNYSCSDITSGIATCSMPQTELTDGSYTLTGTAVDNAGNTSSVNTTVNIDQTPPNVNNVALADNPLAMDKITTLSAKISDNLSGVNKVEYFVGSDPGQGNGTPMVYASASGTAMAALGPLAMPGTYTVYVRSQDVAGNWSNPESLTFTVYPAAASLSLMPNTGNGVVGGTASFTATATDTSNQPVSGITVRYTVSGSVTTSGSCVTDNTGTCTISYTGPQLPGADLIDAYADNNTNDTLDQGEPTTNASMSWDLPLNATTSGSVHGHGRFTASSGDKFNVGFHAINQNGNVSGACNIVDQTTNMVYDCTDATILIENVTTGQATIFGSITIDGEASTYRIDAADNSATDSPDTFNFVTQNGYNVGGTLDSNAKVTVQ